MYSRLNRIVLILSLGLLTTQIHGDTLEFVSPAPNSRLTAGENVHVQYNVHHNGMAILNWAKVHLMTENGFDSGVGTISTTSRPEWQGTRSVTSDFVVPDSLPAGKYVLHVYGSTQQPCEGSVDISSRCEGVLSEMVPVEVVATAATAQQQKTTQDNSVKGKALSLTATLFRRAAYDGRDLALGRSDFTLDNGHPDTKKMLYMLSLI
ncbi:hypothetical protein CPB97_010283 [Podila verticillata]|nr:hypothetical protein CPB97_010283 [Podila verticillata]